MFEEYDECFKISEQEHNEQCSEEINTEYELNGGYEVSYRAEHCIGYVNKDETKAFIAIVDGERSFGRLNLPQIIDVLAAIGTMTKKHGLSNVSFSTKEGLFEIIIT